ncbi:hypothetical protein AGABI2DRAFT_188379 [Agaricus bisporus var. bisporus H97]|uniref:hypothetical protein n=1 Tax=Agaricus bisporus var. bisporus (strain H97 / ATCC MYA-4626 / FGSC 10389) TaxID=936046 RepID=UPI00029F6CB9|nr:hypothetical protein AGABI2DRAFT_188379 [Agaricus bisporus var. bisporus H97]EKV42756.1 hypothetical protein AGABI2DRAFT_188379 [Agaricus bisporus var. bisporus H97]
MSAPAGQDYPQDLVAIFHASFHPTQGNVVDWSLKASDDISLDYLEFSALPSGLHLVEQDVVYFTNNGHHGVCIFRRRKTTEEGHRGFRLTSLGILLAKSRRPRPWRHVASLKQLTTMLYSLVEPSGKLQLNGSDWDLAENYFDERKVRDADLGGAGDWSSWSREFDLMKATSDLLNAPTIHLPHMLRILGPSSLTLFKHVLGRRRILIYTLPPVEAACILCQAAADMCYEAQVTADGSQLKGRNKDPTLVLGMVTLTDLDRLHAESQTGRGWIACTTDAIFLEKPSYYDLIIDLTTSTPSKYTRPTFYSSKPITPQQSNPKVPTHRLSTIRFAWSDVTLWNEIERILDLNADHSSHHACCSPSSIDSPTKSKFVSTWTDAWRVYEDVCIVCAGLWMGSWRGNSTQSYSSANGPENWGAIHLEGDDDLTVEGSYIRNVGMGIEGGPRATPSGGIGNTVSPRTHHPQLSSSSRSIRSGKRRSRQASQEEPPQQGNHDGQLLTMMTLLQVFRAHISFQLSVLESFMPKGISNLGYETDHTLYLTPKDILAFELGPLSGFDAKYLEWLVEEYASGTKVVIKRSWRDFFGAIFGYS